MRPYLNTLTKRLSRSVLTSLSIVIITGCAGEVAKNSTSQSTATSSLAFGDGGYHVDYPKKKHIENPKNKEQFIASELADWLEDYRPREEFDHAPIYIYPNTNIATELGGAQQVGQAMATLCKTKACDFAIQRRRQHLPRWC